MYVIVLALDFDVGLFWVISVMMVYAVTLVVSFAFGCFISILGFTLVVYVFGGCSAYIGWLGAVIVYGLWLRCLDRWCVNLYILFIIYLSGGFYLLLLCVFDFDDFGVGDCCFGVSVLVIFFGWIDYV